MKQLSSGDGQYSVVVVSYKTRALEFAVTHALPKVELTQFLFLADEESQALSGIQIRVKRGAGDVQKADINSKLTASMPAALALGRVEMDIGENWSPVNLRTRFSPTVQIGSVVQCFDRLLGEPRIGIVTLFKHGISRNGELVTDHTLLQKRVS